MNVFIMCLYNSKELSEFLTDCGKPHDNINNVWTSTPHSVKLFLFFPYWYNILRTRRNSRFGKSDAILISKLRINHIC